MKALRDPGPSHQGGKIRDRPGNSGTVEAYAPHQGTDKYLPFPLEELYCISTTRQESRQRTASTLQI